MHRGSACCAAAVALVALFLPASARAEAGDLDTSFAGGVSLVSIGYNRAGELDALALQPDGKLLLGGDARFEAVQGAASRLDFAVARLRADGSLDAAWGDGGVVQTQVGDAGLARVDELLVQPDGKVVAVGQAYHARSKHLALARYLPDGRLDSSFGERGIVLTTVPPSGVQGTSGTTAAVLLPDGKIVAAGFAASSPERAPEEFVLAKYLASGRLDASFGESGLSRRRVGRSVELNALVAQPDGKLVAVGNGLGDASWQSLAARFTADGALDLTFGSGGIATFGAPGWSVPAAYDGALDSAGGIVVTGSTNPSFEGSMYVARLTAHGSLDPGWGSGGLVVVTPQLGPRTDRGQNVGFAVAVQPDGKVLAAGANDLGAFGGGWQFDLVRLTPGGAVDPSFGNGGRVRTSIHDGERTVSARARALALHPDGRIALGGPSIPSGSSYWVVARYLGDTPAAPDTTPPDTTISAGPPEVAPHWLAEEILFASSEDGSTFECSLDSAPFASCASPWTQDGHMPPGPHEFRVRAVDASGNVDPTPAVWRWTVVESPLHPDALNPGPSGSDGSGSTTGSAPQQPAEAPGSAAPAASSEAPPAAAARASSSAPAGSTRVGTAGRDLLVGTPRRDTLRGLAGDDRLLGRAGDDLLDGGRGSDTLDGGGGRDRLRGGPGSDRVLARDAGRDLVECGSGRDVVFADRADSVARNCERVSRR